MFESRVFASRWISGALAAAAIVLVSCHREAEVVLPEFVIEDGEKAGCVWVADSPGTKGRLYLCGTIHILREQDYPLAPGYEAAYANSKKLLLELPPGSGSGPAMAARMRELGMYSADTALEANVSPATWQAVKKWAASRGLEASSLNRYRPWFLSLIITATEYARLGAKPDMGVDLHFEKRAAQEGKPGEGLETVEFQLQMFAKLTNDQQRDLLEQTLAEIQSLPQEYEKMIAAWKQGDLETLHGMLFKEAEKYPELMDLFLSSRNRAWMNHLEPLLRKGEKVMVLVGTGHLTSSSGLLQMLRDRGFTVRHYREVQDL